MPARIWPGEIDVVIARSHRVSPSASPTTGSATKQSRAQYVWLLDCFAALAMTQRRYYSYLFKSGITRLATSRFQMNSTTSAPIVAVMKPAPWSGP